MPKEKRKKKSRNKIIKKEQKTEEFYSLADEDLMLLCQQGEMKAFDVIYKRYSKRIMQFIYGLVGDYEQTENITQEVFLRIFKYSSTYSYPQKFSTWIFALTRNLCRTYLRKEMKKTKELSLESLKYSEIEKNRVHIKPVDNIQKEESKERVRKAVASLPPIYREVIFLYFFEGFNYEEIGEIVGTSPSTLRSRMFHGIRKLRKLIEGGDIT